MPKIDDIDSEMTLQFRREEEQMHKRQEQEKRWKRRQLKYSWLANIIAIVALILSIVQFFYTTSKELEQQEQIDKIDIELQRIHDEYEIRSKVMEETFRTREDSLLRLKAAIEREIKLKQIHN